MHFFQLPADGSELSGIEVISPQIDSDGRLDKWPETSLTSTARVFATCSNLQSLFHTMTVSLVFNELSLRRPAPDRRTARAWMTEFVKTLKAAIDHKVTVLRMRDNFGDFPLSLDYPMGAWFGDNSVSRDESEFVLAYATQYSFIRPYDEDLRDDEEFQSGKLAFEGRFGDDKAEGLGFAYLLNGLAFSILSESCWDTP